jgi:hypothetical protein
MAAILYLSLSVTRDSTDDMNDICGESNDLWRSDVAIRMSPKHCPQVNVQDTSVLADTILDYCSWLLWSENVGSMDDKFM